MSIILKSFQKDAVNILVEKIETAQQNYEGKDGQLQAITFSSPTGSGKTIVITKVIERIFTDWKNKKPSILWLSDNPDLNEQSKHRIRQHMPKRSFELVQIENSFADETLQREKMYFLNTQKLSSTSGLVNRGDSQEITIWETIENTIKNRKIPLVCIIDEAHRGLRGNNNGKKINTIISRFYDGIENKLSPLPIIIGMSATPEHFCKYLKSSEKERFEQKVTIDPEEVRDSGLLKEQILITNPKSLPQATMHTSLVEACQHYNNKFSEWKKHDVKPVMVIQVEDKSNADEYTRSDLGAILSTIKEEINLKEIHNDGAIVHCLGDQKGKKIMIGISKISSIEPMHIQDDHKVRVVIFKTALSTGWDCPRAEVMISYRTVRDKTLISQLVGRMMRNPLAKRMSSSENLNDVYLCLPRYDDKALRDIKIELTKDGIIGDDDINSPDELKEHTISQKRIFLTSRKCFYQLPSHRKNHGESNSCLHNLVSATDKLLQKDIIGNDRKNKIIEDISMEVVRYYHSKNALNDNHERDGKAHLSVSVLDSSDLSRVSSHTRDVDRSTKDIVEMLNFSKKILTDVVRNFIHDYYENEKNYESPRIADILYRVCKNSDFKISINEFAQRRLAEMDEKYSAKYQKLCKDGEEMSDFKSLRHSKEGYHSNRFDLPKIWRWKTNKNWMDTEDWIECDNHLYLRDNKFRCRLNRYEIAALNYAKEIPNFKVWLRNIDRKPWSLGVAWDNPKAISKSLFYPDFVCFYDDESKEEEFIASIIDPHWDNDPDVVPRTKGLASYAEKYQDKFKSIILTKGNGEDEVFKILDLSLDHDRNKVRSSSTPAEIYNLFREPQSFYHV